MAMIHSNRLAGWPVWGSGNDEQVGSICFLLLTSFHDGLSLCLNRKGVPHHFSKKAYKPVHTKMILGESSTFQKFST